MVLKADAVFEGGGVKGIALVGAMAVTEEKGYRFENVAGTSAGAICAALVAAGYSGSEMKGILEELDYNRFKDRGPEDRIPIVGEALSLGFEKGIYEGDYFEGWMRSVLAAKGIRTFRDLVMETYRDIPPYRYRLRVVAADISRGKMLVLPQDIVDYQGIDPDALDVARAVRMSMSIPFFFEPVVLKSRDTGEDCTIVDGGLLSNFPVWLFDDGTPDPPWPTFGYLLVEDPNQKEGRVRHRIRGPMSCLAAIFSTMLEAHDRRYVRDADFVRSIPIPTLGVRTTDFGLSKRKVEALYESGRSAAEAFFRGWDFQAYKREFRARKAPGRRARILSSFARP